MLLRHNTFQTGSKHNYEMITVPGTAQCSKIQCTIEHPFIMIFFERKQLVEPVFQQIFSYLHITVLLLAFEQATYSTSFY